MHHNESCLVGAATLEEEEEEKEEEEEEKEEEEEEEVWTIIWLCSISAIDLSIGRFI